MKHRALHTSIALLAGLLFAIALVGCSSNASSEESESTESVTLEIYAANSLEKALNEAQELYTSQNPHLC